MVAEEDPHSNKLQLVAAVAVEAADEETTAIIHLKCNIPTILVVQQDYVPCHQVLNLDHLPINTRYHLVVILVALLVVDVPCIIMRHHQ